VDRVQHDDVEPVVDHLQQLALLLGRVRLRAGVDDLPLAAGEGVHLALEDGVVELLVARVGLLRQQQSDLHVVALGGAGVVAASGRVEHTAPGEQDGQRGGGHHGYGVTTHAKVHFSTNSGRGHSSATHVTESQRFTRHRRQEEPLNEVDTTRSADLVRDPGRIRGTAANTCTYAGH